MWDRLLEPGLALMSGSARNLHGFAQELTHDVVHAGHHVLWCDGDHGFDPYDFAELNLTRGRDAADGATRILVKRCMTPFQWDTVLTQHLQHKLAETEARLALAVPFDRLFSTDEITDWESEDYVRYAVKHLRNLARRYRIPILLGADMNRWWRTHPILAQMTFDAADAHWDVARPAGRWRITQGTGHVLDPELQGRVTLLDFLGPEVTSPSAVPVPVPRLVTPRPTPARKPTSWRYRSYPVDA